MSEEQEKQPGRLRRFAGNRVRPVKNLVNPVIGRDEDGNEVRSFQAGSSLGRMFQTIGSAFGVVGHWFRPSSDDRQSAERPFDEVARQWGLAKQDLPKIKRGLRLEQLVYGLIALIGLSQVVVGIMNMGGPFWGVFSRIFLGSMAMVAALLMMAIATWRLDVINQKRFRPFSLWIRGS